MRVGARRAPMRDAKRSVSASAASTWFWFCFTDVYSKSCIVSLITWFVLIHTVFLNGSGSGSRGVLIGSQLPLFHVVFLLGLHPVLFHVVSLLGSFLVHVVFLWERVRVHVVFLLGCI